MIAEATSVARTYAYIVNQLQMDISYESPRAAFKRITKGLKHSTAYLRLSRALAGASDRYDCMLHALHSTHFKYIVGVLGEEDCRPLLKYFRHYKNGCSLQMHPKP